MQYHSRRTTGAVRAVGLRRPSAPPESFANRCSARPRVTGCCRAARRTDAEDAADRASRRASRGGCYGRRPDDRRRAERAPKDALASGAHGPRRGATYDSRGERESTALAGVPRRRGSGAALGADSEVPAHGTDSAGRPLAERDGQIDTMRSPIYPVSRRRKSTRSILGRSVAGSRFSM